MVQKRKPKAGSQQNYVSTSGSALISCDSQLQASISLN
jgi:hypothetical protein